MNNENFCGLSIIWTPHPLPPHPDPQLYPMFFLLSEGHIMPASAWFQCTAIALYALLLIP